jgi:hypothetical protein
MSNISLPEAMRDYAERQGKEGSSENGATAFHQLRRDLGAAAAERTEEVDLRALLLACRSKPA